MSYDLHITRASFWFESEKDPITEQEWNQYIITDPQFHAGNEISVTPPSGSKISIHGGFALWNYEEEGIEVPFRYSRGRISVSGAGDDENVVNKMKEIATILSAKVIGDEGETY
ncbi:hypothetical protein [Brevibacillus sp. SYSU BS000544]|uniref:hypothetical protein n=1 Tax=Brevibacillus sp. SYSU BS000544 TaxID=3416443 RepID=UPI003CE4E396